MRFLLGVPELSLMLGSRPSVPAERLQPLNKNAFAIGELLALPADMRLSERAQ